MFDIDFFRDEIRNGFYIPTAIKQSWAAQLDVLAAIDRICEANGISYYADWGTLLGAVRHGGFVPWDDDLDICMKRDDYVRFRELADNQLPKGYTIHDYKNKEDHWLFLARVVNNDRMCFEEEYLAEHYNFPWLACVDIFIKDYLYADVAKEKRRDKEVMDIIALADGMVGGHLSKGVVSARLNAIQRRYCIKLPAKYRTRDVAVALYGLAEERMARVNAKDSDTVGQIYPWILKGQKGEPKAFYEKTIRLPFEDTTIPVPAYYHKVLNRRYPGCHVAVKKWDGHEYPAFEGQKAEMERLLGKKLPGFAFDKTMLERPPLDDSASLKTIAKKCLAELDALLLDAQNALVESRPGDLVQMLNNCQQLAAELGDVTEEIKGESDLYAQKTVEALQAFCDALWEEYLAFESGKDITSLSLSFQMLRALKFSVRENILERREILFLPVGAKEWGILSCIAKEMADDKTDVRIVPLPLLKKDMYGNILMTDEEIVQAVRPEQYPPDLAYFDWTRYDIRCHCPDCIFFQNPYDAANPYLTVPPDFYAENMRAFTNELVYVPIGKTAEFSEADANDQYNLKHYVTAPGIIFADRVIVQSENIKRQYVRALTAFAGADTRDAWKEKITSDESFFSGSDMAGERRTRLLYCIGANELSEHADIFLDAVNSRILSAKEYADDIQLTICLYPNDKEQWRLVNQELSEQFFAELSKAVSEGFEMIDACPENAEGIAEQFDAYYGSMSPFATAFADKNKPVMFCCYREEQDEYEKRAGQTE